MSNSTKAAIQEIARQHLTPLEVGVIGVGGCRPSLEEQLEERLDRAQITLNKFKTGWTRDY